MYLRGRPRLAATAAQRVAFMFGCFLFGVLAVRDTTMGKLLILATLCLVIYWVRPQLMAVIAICLACGTFPEGLPAGKVIGPVAIYGHHAPLLLAIGYMIPIVRPRLSTWLLPIMFMCTVIYFAVLGFEMGHDIEVVVREATFLLEIVGGFVVAVLIVRSNFVWPAIHGFAATLWFSAAMIIASSLYGIRLEGRSEDLEVPGITEVTRLVTHSAVPAQAALVTLVAAQIVGRVRPVLYLTVGVPALIISLLGFAREIFIELAVAVVVSFLASFDFSAVRRSGKMIVVGAAVFAITVPGALFLLQESHIGEWLDGQFTAFNHRVFGGMSSKALAVDQSNLDRLVEDRALIDKISEAPIFGHGLGYRYRLPFGGGDWAFADTYGTTYSHNFYLWWLCKSGAVGMAAFAVFALTPVVYALRSSSPQAKIAAAVSTALIVVSVVDPIPEEAIEGMVLGLALGTAMTYATFRRHRIEADAVPADRPAALAGASA